MLEIWKNISFNEQYQVSNFGNVKSLISNKILKGRPCDKGYLYVVIKQKNYSIHRLVASHFFEDKNTEKLQVNHLDCNKSNNNLENLEWCTNKENMLHAKENNRFKKFYGIDNKKSIKVTQIDKYNGNILKVWDSISDIKRELNIDIKSIIYCCQNKIYKSAGGYKWQYLN
jgi:hypothetical protein